MRASRDGIDLPKAEALGVWQKFSAWMEAHPGDLAGFAEEIGTKSVRPTLDARGPVLLISGTEVQQAYGSPKGMAAAPASTASTGSSSRPTTGKKGKKGKKGGAKGEDPGSPLPKRRRS